MKLYRLKKDLLWYYRDANSVRVGLEAKKEEPPKVM
jgi:hypothetical protein